MQHFFLSYKNSRVSYYLFGTGQQTVLCFHGYGENATGYGFLEKTAGNQFSFIAMDLPFHGKTEWNEGLSFTETDLQQVINEILVQQRYKSQPGNNKLVLIGFSLGGRFVLSLYQRQPETIAKIVLLAPDGLKVNFWYWLAAKTWFGNKLFAFTMKRPGWFFKLLQWQGKLKLVNASVLKFVNHYISDEKARRILYERWTGLRKLKPDLKKIKVQVKQNKTQVRLVYGRYDRIILPVRGEKFKKGIEEYCTLKIIESGHQLLHEKHGEEIRKALLH